MSKRLLSFLTVIVMTILMAVPAFAGTPRVIDNADLLTPEEEMSLEAKLDEISERQQYDVVVDTEEDVPGNLQSYTESFLGYNGYGMGEGNHGCVIVIDMADRDYWIYSSNGLSDIDIDNIGEEITPYLSNGDYANAFDVYADYVDANVDPDAKEPLFSMQDVLIAVAAGFFIAFIVANGHKSKLKSVRFQAAANDYVREGSFRLRGKRDRFLYKTVTRTKKPEKSSGGSSSSKAGSSSGGGHF